MKGFSRIASIVMLVTLVACNGGADKQETIVQENITTVEKNALVRMNDYHYVDTVTMNRAKYSYEVVRKVDDSLAVVTDESGDCYADNYILLTVKREGVHIFSKRFTKATFASYFDEEFCRNSILEGMAFDRVTDSGLRFSFSVSYPMSDMCMPFSVTVSSNGVYTITRDELLDTEAPEEVTGV
ncbi:MAG: DUF4738 domain-containing protein [Paraprevotella sp.]|nr:DUF4738 domain-containing protein [Paraprevotella sp.]